MPASPQLAEILRESAHEVLLWVGFGTLVGLAAKAIMPGRDPGGAFGTTMMGIVGSVLGCGVIAFFFDQHITPISSAGFGAGTGGSFLILLFYRVLAGSLFVEAEDGERTLYRSTRARRRRVLRNG